MALDYDFSGWATRAGVRCYDGLTISEDAFKDCDGKKVPVVWNHDHTNPENVLGHALLQNRKGGVYAFVKMNDTPSGLSALAAVKNGDIDAMSIFANGIRKTGQTVMHGLIQELSLVIAGCNPGALIDEIVAHSADCEGECIIYDDRGLSLEHGLDPDGEPLEEIKMARDEKPSDKTVKEVFDTLTEEQKTVVYALIGAALEDKKEDANVKHNVFDRDDENVLMHTMDELDAAVKDSKRCGSMKESFLEHSIDTVDWLFNDDHELNNPPQVVDVDMGWVNVVLNGVRHIPFSRFKSMFADLTDEDAKAKGYLKGNFKKEQVFSLLKRSTSATTIYLKQKMDRDDQIEITSFDVVAWLKKEMRKKLDAEIARAILIGDGRVASSDDKISEEHIRPIYKDDDFYTIKCVVSTSGLNTPAEKVKAAINAIIKARKDYKGSGNPTFFTTEDTLTEMLLLEDKMGRPLYDDEAALARKLRVRTIVTVPYMEGMKGAHGGDFVGLVVNLSDYTVGADKGGAVNMFEDFDIDYNAEKYLIETRCSGALHTPFSAIAVEYAA